MKKKLKAKKDVNNPKSLKSQALVTSKKSRGFSTKKPAKAHLSYPL